MLRGLKLETATGLKRRVLLAAERMAGASAQVVICNSNSLRTEAIALGVAPASKMVVLGNGSSNGVDLERFSPGASDVRGRFGVPPDALVVGFVGRLTRDKGVPELVAAFDTIVEAEPRAHLLLVGWFDASDDLLGEDVRRRIESHSQIHLTGFVDVEATAAFYRAMDVMVLPTWREGFPTVVLEAASTEVPVITTICTGSRDSVVPEVTGLLIPPGYPEAISEAVVKLLRDPERRVRMGRAARMWVREHFIEERVLQLTATYYTGLLEPASAGRMKQQAYSVPGSPGKSSG
jgi:glycosyltransferase involved in cell wall biosynthesis